MTGSNCVFDPVQLSQHLSAFFTNHVSIFTILYYNIRKIKLLITLFYEINALFSEKEQAVKG